MKLKKWTCVLFIVLFIATEQIIAQNSVYDTIRLGSITEHGQAYPMVLLPEFVKKDLLMDPKERTRRQRLRNDIYVTYPYALTAAIIFNEVNSNLDSIDRRRDRRKYLKTMDKKLDRLFKEPLKNLSIDQGHVLIKLINRQTGQNCYSLIKEMKGGLSAMVWQSVGLFFNNNLVREYDPEDRDREIESIVKDLEASNLYRYQIYQQEALLKKAMKP